MSNYDNTNRGALFKNKDKQSDTHADYKGQINVDGADFWLSAWIKKDKNGNSYMSLSVQAKQGSKPKPSKPAKQAPDDFVDSIPF